LCGIGTHPIAVAKVCRAIVVEGRPSVLWIGEVLKLGRDRTTQGRDGANSHSAAVKYAGIALGACTKAWQRGALNNASLHTLIIFHETTALLVPPV